MHATTVLASMLYTEESIFRVYYFYFIRAQLRINKPHLVQAGRSMRVANLAHTCNNGDYRYFKRLCSAVISN